MSSELNNGCGYECQKRERIDNEKNSMLNDKKKYEKAKQIYEVSKDIYYTSTRGAGWDRDKNALLENKELEKKLKNNINSLNLEFNKIIKNYDDKLTLKTSQKNLIDRNKKIKLEKNNTLEKQRKDITSLKESVSTKDRIIYYEKQKEEKLNKTLFILKIMFYTNISIVSLLSIIKLIKKYRK